MPKTYAELLNHIIAGKNAFMDLPVETRAKFGHSFERWLASMDDPVDFATKMGIDVKNESPAVEDHAHLEVEISGSEE